MRWGSSCVCMPLCVMCVWVQPPLLPLLWHAVCGLLSNLCSMQALVLLGFVAQVTRHFSSGSGASSLSDDMRRRVSELVVRCLCSPSIAVVSRAISFFAAPDGPNVFGVHMHMLQGTLVRIAETHWSPVLRANAEAALGSVQLGPRWPPRSPQACTPTPLVGEAGDGEETRDAPSATSFTSLALSSSHSPVGPEPRGVAVEEVATGHVWLAATVPQPPLPAPASLAPPTQAAACSGTPLSPVHAAKVR